MFINHFQNTFSNIYVLISWGAVVWLAVTMFLFIAGYRKRFIYPSLFAQIFVVAVSLLGYYFGAGTAGVPYGVETYILYFVDGFILLMEILAVSSPLIFLLLAIKYKKTAVSKIKNHPNKIVLFGMSIVAILYYCLVIGMVFFDLSTYTGIQVSMYIAIFATAVVYLAPKEKGAV